MSKTFNIKRNDVHRYKVTSKSKTIYKLICLWSKSQSDRKQSIIFICELMRRLFADRDLIASVMRSQNENALTAMREFTSDICVVTFNPKDSRIPTCIDVAFYKDKYMDTRMYNWLDSQTSIVNSISFAVYLFIRSFGMGDTTTIISDMILEHKEIFMDKLNTIMMEEVAGE